MKPKAHILIVEDEALLYKRMKMVLTESHFSVGPYTPSVDVALRQIQLKRPDIVLLDIDLEGILSGFDLGELLHNEYCIPFIYVTDFSDDATFYNGLATNHEQFLIKTKPHLDTNELLRGIHTVLKRYENKKVISKKSILGLTNYLDKLKEGGLKDLSQVPVNYENICYFTVAPFHPPLKDYPQKEDDPFVKLRTNYLWFLTKEGDKYLFKSSLRDLVGKLPNYFVRINDKYIVNISPNIMDGRINGSRLSIAGLDLQIKETYKDEVKKRFDVFYNH